VDEVARLTKEAGTDGLVSVRDLEKALAVVQLERDIKFGERPAEGARAKLASEAALRLAAMADLETLLIPEGRSIGRAVT
jgi:hypothetical protein